MAKKHKILLIDDDIDELKFYERVLTNTGIEVESATGAAEGLEKAQEGGYSLILLDIMMPGVDGLALLASLKEQKPKTKNGPIIVLTNLTEKKILRQAKTRGAKDYLIKVDLSPKEFVKKVKSFLK